MPCGSVCCAGWVATRAVVPSVLPRRLLRAEVLLLLLLLHVLLHVLLVHLPVFVSTHLRKRYERISPRAGRGDRHVAGREEEDALREALLVAVHRVAPPGHEVDGALLLIHAADSR